MIRAVLDTNVLKVGYLVTFNQRHFPAERLPAVKVVSPKEFLHILQSIVP